MAVDTTRSARWARFSAGLKARREALAARLGGRCVECGSTESLEFDHHPNGRTWSVRRTSPAARMALYEAEAAGGRLRLLCKLCNRRLNRFVRVRVEVIEIIHGALVHGSYGDAIETLRDVLVPWRAPSAREARAAAQVDLPEVPE